MMEIHLGIYSLFSLITTSKSINVSLSFHGRVHMMTVASEMIIMY